MKSFMRLEVSVELSIWLNKCFRRFKLSLGYSDWFLSSQSSFPSALRACLVDVFDHPKFYVEFSHLVNRGFDATVSPLLKSHFDWRYVLDVLNVLLNIQIYCWVVNDTSLQLIIANEVYVFEHPRYCDEFSHLANRGFHATATLFWSLTLIE